MGGSRVEVKRGHAQFCPAQQEEETAEMDSRFLAAGDRLDLDTLYPYTADRLGWLASHLEGAGYCDEAAEGGDGPPPDILAYVAWGMDRELREVFGLVRSKLEEIAEEPDDEDADPE
jgi:hypothetical protein